MFVWGAAVRGSGYSLSHMSVHCGVSRQLLSGEFPRSLLFLSPFTSCVFNFHRVSSASLYTDITLRGALLLDFFSNNILILMSADLW